MFVKLVICIHLQNFAEFFHLKSRIQKIKSDWQKKLSHLPTVPNKETNSCEPTSLFHVLGLLVSGILRSMQKPNSPTRHHPPLSRFRRLGWMLPIRLNGFDDRWIILVGDLFFKKYPSKCEKRKLIFCVGALDS